MKHKNRIHLTICMHIYISLWLDTENVHVYLTDTGNNNYYYTTQNKENPLLTTTSKLVQLNFTI